VERWHAETERLPVVEVPVAELLGVISPRSGGEVPGHVEVLADCWDELPPIVVHAPSMRVIDGAHRLKAARLRGAETIAVRFYEGGEADAFVLAVAANVAHGLPLSLADRKRAAARIMEFHPNWSARLVASATGISPATVAEIRRRMPGESPDARLGRDGKVRPIRTAEGRRIAREMIAENPDLSLRQIARASGVSPETVRTLKNRLLNGESVPVAVRRQITQPEERDKAAMVERLKSDPALRFTESGRDVLRLLNLNVIRADEWDRLIASVPLHSRAVVAKLARDCAERWANAAQQMSRRPEPHGNVG
jgi:ParB-like chromosome segregation protein Spo0J